MMPESLTPKQILEDILKNIQKTFNINDMETASFPFVAFDAIRDVDADMKGMRFDAGRLVEQKADDLNLAAKFGPSMNDVYKKKLFSIRYWMDSLSGKMDAAFRQEEANTAPYFKNLKIALESIAILDPAKPHIYSWTRDANRVNPETGMTKRQTFESLTPHEQRWIVKHAADYRNLLDQGIKMNFFDKPDC